MKMYWIKLPLVFIVLLASLQNTFASESWQQRLQQANQAYQKGLYDSSISAYDGLIKDGWESGSLHYNLGNAYFQQGELSLSLWHYLKAQQLLPRDEDVEANLRFALRETEDIFDGRSPHPLSAIFFWLEDFSLKEHLWGLLWIQLTLCVLAGAKLVGNKDAIYKPVQVFIGLFILGLCSTGARWHLDHSHTLAVVQTDTVKVTEEKEASGQVLLLLHEGAILTVLRSEGESLEVELPSGENGWIPGKAALLLPSESI